MAELKQIADIVFGVIVAAIAIGGGYYGIYCLYEGITGDQPAEKKKGFTVLIVVVVILVAMFQLKPLLYSLAKI
jgi:hypothetical protein